MTEFEELKTVQRIMALYRERGQERTPADIREYSRRIIRQGGLSPQASYQVIEGHLLEKNPNPENWEDS